MCIPATHQIVVLDINFAGLWWAFFQGVQQYMRDVVVPAVAANARCFEHNDDTADNSGRGRIDRLKGTRGTNHIARFDRTPVLAGLFLDCLGISLYRALVYWYRG